MHARGTCPPSGPCFPPWSEERAEFLTYCTLRPLFCVYGQGRPGLARVAAQLQFAGARCTFDALHDYTGVPGSYPFSHNLSDVHLHGIQ